MEFLTLEQLAEKKKNSLPQVDAVAKTSKKAPLKKKLPSKKKETVRRTVRDIPDHLKASPKRTEAVPVKGCKIDSIFVSARGINGSKKDWSRNVQIVLDDGTCLYFCWDDKGQVYYTREVEAESSRITQYIRNCECYELDITQPGIKVITPEFLTTDGSDGLKDVLLKNEKAPIKTSGEPPVGKIKKKRKVVLDSKDTCSDHPKYSGKRRPRSGCKRCWELYLKANPDSNLEIVEGPDE